MNATVAAQYDQCDDSSTVAPLSRLKAQSLASLSFTVQSSDNPLNLMSLLNSQQTHNPPCISTRSFSQQSRIKLPLPHITQIITHHITALTFDRHHAQIHYLKNISRRAWPFPSGQLASLNTIKYLSFIFMCIQFYIPIVIDSPWSYMP